MIGQHLKLIKLLAVNYTSCLNFNQKTKQTVNLTLGYKNMKLKQIT